MIETDALHEIIGISILAAWPVIPLFWIPAHLFHGFFRKYLGMFTYGITAVLWGPCIWFILKYSDMLLQHDISVPVPVSMTGCFFLAAGLILQLWTAAVMGSVIIGIPEVTSLMKSRHVDTPPFNWCRHPTYLAHTMIFGGAALMTGYAALFILTAADMLITQLLIIPFEEKELLNRLGRPYREYMEKTPRFIPRFKKN